MNATAIGWIVGAALYVICPLDFDFIPVLGWVDDAFVVWTAVKKVREQMNGKAAQMDKVIEV